MPHYEGDDRPEKHNPEFMNRPIRGLGQTRIEREELMSRNAKMTELRAFEMSHMEDTETRPNTISAQIENLGEQLSKLGALVSELGDRLDPVLRPDMEASMAVSDDGSVMRTPDSLVTNVLAERIRQVKMLQERIASLGHRVQL